MIERYTRPEMAQLWSVQHKYELWCEVECLAVEAWASLGVVPAEEAAAVRRNAHFTVARVTALEQETHHDVVAFTRALSESMGAEKRWVHYGLTSNDVVDTAQAVLIKEAAALIDTRLKALLDALRTLALQHKQTVMIGRTHGIHAEPITFGIKVAGWYTELQRNRVRLQDAFAQAAVGKLSGAVGTFGTSDPRVEAYVCSHLGIGVEPVATQVVARDRHAQLIFAIALTATGLDRIATEIRALQKTEVREVAEPFSSGQKGSSAMPHKRNPIQSEQVSGLARVLRGFVLSALEDVVLWHERDISHSSVERVILPDATTLLHYLLGQMEQIVSGLEVSTQHMSKNLSLTQGLYHSERVLLALVDAGLSREQAYDLVQQAAMTAWQQERPFRETLTEAGIQRFLGDDQLDALFDPATYLGHIDDLFQRAGLEPPSSAP